MDAFVGILVCVGLAFTMLGCGGSGSEAADAEDLADELSTTSLSCGPLSSIDDDAFDDDTPGVPDREIECSAGETDAAVYVWDSGEIDEDFVQSVFVERACRFEVSTAHLRGSGWVAGATRYIEERDVNDVDQDVLQEIADATGGRIEEPTC